MEDNGDGDGEQREDSASSAVGEEVTDEEEQHFDISLAASHSYMGSGLVAVGGQGVVEAGWRGRVPVRAHHGAVFPGETVPMLLGHAHDAALLAAAIDNDKLFGLLCPDESGVMVSGYGVLCEVFEAGAGEAPRDERDERDEDDEDEEAERRSRPPLLSFKARARHRFRLVDPPKHAGSIHMYARVRYVEVVVLGEVRAADALHASRLASLHARRRHSAQLDWRLRRMDAALTPWPRFLYDMFDYHRMRQIIKDYFSSIMSADKLPEEPVSLSFWVASNLPLAARDRLALFAVDSALLRLHMEVRLIARKSGLCCSSCMSEIARREHIFAMSSEGVHSNYTNSGGYMHDVVTVSRVTNTRLSGEPSVEYSWFPGYSWTIALCAACRTHVGWKFEAVRRGLRPAHFYGLCRNVVQPCRPHPAPRTSPP